VRDVLESGDISFDGPGGKITMQKNHHATKNVYIGETKADGQFKIIKTFYQVKGEPFLKGTFMKGGAAAASPAPSTSGT
jgi:urea transport system substrate-binding protein